MTYTIESAYKDWDLYCLRQQAQKAIELDSENKIESEILNEVDNLVVKALLTAIRRYDSLADVKSYDTPETLYELLWHECYEHEWRHVRDNTYDVELRAIDQLYDALKVVRDYIANEYNHRLKELETSKETQP
jgi:hypothetical protein